jgi:hypothetical protein
MSSAHLSATHSTETPEIVSRDHFPPEEVLLEALSYYRSIGGTFACVQVPEEININEFRHERPFLLLAIVVVTRWRHRTDQSRLEQDFLKDLGDRFFVKGEKSMDLLQGLLVYLNW